MKITLAVLGMLLLAGGAYAQGDKDAAASKPSTEPASVAVAAGAPKIIITAQSTPIELARAAQMAHGGDKFKSLRSISMRGTADASAPGSTQTILSTFYIVTSGDKSRFELNNPMAPFTQVYDGQVLYNSLPQIQIPPMSRLGISILQKVEDSGCAVSAIPDKKKKRGFKITTPDGYATDFYIDAVTGLVDSIEAKFIAQGREVSTAIAFDKFREVEGLRIPEKFSQRLDFGGMSVYASFKAKVILINSELPENTFVIPQ